MMEEDKAEDVKKGEEGTSKEKKSLRRRMKKEKYLRK